MSRRFVDESRERYETVAVRPPAVAAEGMAATSQPLATLAALDALRAGGNAVDAAVTAAAVLCVTEPMSTGLGGDCFAILHSGGELHGLDAAGPAPAGADPDAPVEELGPRSVDVPGAVGGWAEILGRFGRRGLDAALAPAIDLARGGFLVGYRAAQMWQAIDGLPESFGPAPRAGDRWRSPELGDTLARIAEEGPDALYRGSVADAICAATWLEPDDLTGYAARWVEPLVQTYRDVQVAELPAPTQGVVALEALALLADGDAPTLDQRVQAVRLALEDGLANVRDGFDGRELLAADHIRRRRGELPGAVAEPAGGTVYFCVADGDGLAVSFVQSIFYGFGSRVTAPGTGVVLQNRAACFSVGGRVEPGRRPYHTIIPGFLLDRDGAPLGPFGCMGGFIQAQAHAQLVWSMVDDGLDPQQAIDCPRFRVDGDQVAVEPGLWEDAKGLQATTGLRPHRDTHAAGFGCGQTILRHGDGWVAGTDSRRDGLALGF